METNIFCASFGKVHLAPNHPNLAKTQTELPRTIWRIEKRWSTWESRSIVNTFLSILFFDMLPGSEVLYICYIYIYLFLWFDRSMSLLEKTGMFSIWWMLEITSCCLETSSFCTCWLKHNAALCATRLSSPRLMFAPWTWWTFPKHLCYLLGGSFKTLGMRVKLLKSSQNFSAPKSQVNL